MNRYEFEDLISDYLEGKMTFKKIKEFESFLESNEESRTLVNNVRNSITDLNRLDRVVASTSFNEKLLSKPPLKEKYPRPSKRISGPLIIFFKILPDAGPCISILPARSVRSSTLKSPSEPELVMCFAISPPIPAFTTTMKDCGLSW